MNADALTREALAAFAEGKRAAFEAELKTLVEIPSVSSDPDRAGDIRACAEAAVVGFPHEIKGEGIFAYVILNPGWEDSQELMGELKNEVRHHIGPFATPDIILVTPGLPKTRSGKIMRRILRKIAAEQYTDLGDLTTLADPTIVEHLVEKRKTL